MLYVLPPPTTRPPSVWDLVVDFHHKECEKNVAHHSKKLLRFHCHEPKQSQLLGSKTLALDQSNVSEKSESDLKTKSVSLSRKNQTGLVIIIRKISSVFQVHFFFLCRFCFDSIQMKKISFNFYFFLFHAAHMSRLYHIMMMKKNDL